MERVEGVGGVGGVGGVVFASLSSVIISLMFIVALAADAESPSVCSLSAREYRQKTSYSSSRYLTANGSETVDFGPG